MIATISYKNKKLKVNLAKPLDISIPIDGTSSNVNAWYVVAPVITPHEVEGKQLSVAQGAAVNFNDISFNPHAHGTHTECAGHITEEVYAVNDYLNRYFFLAEVITIAPEKLGDDFVISKKQLQYALGKKKREAVVIRTIPNTTAKKNKQYSNTNPPFIMEEAMQFLVDAGVDHLLIDLPSVDKEKDNGALLAHNTFWNAKRNVKERLHATITEFIYVPNAIKDGTYLLNLQVAPFVNDASPSRPVLYAVED